MNAQLRLEQAGAGRSGVAMGSAWAPAMIRKALARPLDKGRAFRDRCRRRGRPSLSGSPAGGGPQGRVLLLPRIAARLDRQR
jgi:hypothetical protein